MTLLGKIFTVLIFISALVMMVIAMVVYATHQNWQEAYQAKNQQLATAQADNAKLESQYQNQITELNADHEAVLQEVRKLESELETVARLNATTQGEVDELRQERRAAVGAVASTEENNKTLMDEVVALRGSIRENQQARDEAVITTLKATSELHTAAGQLQAIRERSAQLIQQLATATSSLLSHGIDPTADVIVPAYGEITRTRREDGGQLIEITIGYDDGIREQQTVEIYRGDRYIGRAKIIRTDPDRAVGQVLREFQQGQIQEGDRVATKLRVG